MRHLSSFIVFGFMSRMFNRSCVNQINIKYQDVSSCQANCRFGREFCSWSMTVIHVSIINSYANKGALMENKMKKKFFKKGLIVISLLFIFYCFLSYYWYVRPPTCDVPTKGEFTHILINQHPRPHNIWNKMFNVPREKDCIHR